jgi:predicted aminopeptidase
MVARVVKLTLELVLMLFVASCLCCAKYTSYLSQAAAGQMRILAKSEPIDDYLKDTAIPDSVRQKLQLVKEIRAYAFDKLGLLPTSNYTKFFDQQGKPLLWVVSASKEFTLEPKMWWFPIVGNVSYKGFFSLDGARDLADDLQADGYDTRIREVNAWSTLGWFSDPVMSTMLEYPEADLAELLFHELSHSTIYIKGNVDFSESLANFIGMRGAIMYMQDKYGKDSKECMRYVNDIADIDRFEQYMLNGAIKLDSLYGTMKGSDNPIGKRKLKQAYIAKIVANLDTVNFIDKGYYYHVFDNRPLPNNAYFIVKRQYNSKMNFFADEMDKIAGGDLVKYIAYLREKYKK